MNLINKILKKEYKSFQESIKESLNEKLSEILEDERKYISENLLAEESEFDILVNNISDTAKVKVGLRQTEKTKKSIEDMLKTLKIKDAKDFTKVFGRKNPLNKAIKAARDFHLSGGNKESLDSVLKEDVNMATVLSGIRKIVDENQADYIALDDGDEVFVSPEIAERVSKFAASLDHGELEDFERNLSMNVIEFQNVLAQVGVDKDTIEQTINENFLLEANLSGKEKEILNKVKDAVDGMKLVDMRKPLENLFGKKNVGFSFSPFPNFMIKDRVGTIVLVNKKYVDDPDVLSGEVAIGILK